MSTSTRSTFVLTAALLLSAAAAVAQTPASPGGTSTAPAAASPSTGPTPGAAGNNRASERSVAGPIYPSAAGGPRDTLANCMSFWDKGTHMTKAEWRATCIRSKNLLDETQIGDGKSQPRKSRRAERQ